MNEYKILFTGAMGAGKTTAISAVSETPPVVTDVHNSDLSVAKARTTVGLGQFRCLDGRWSMEMQMSTGTTDTVNHWAYMVSCETGDPCEQQVPGTTLSLAAFMAQTPTEP